VAKPYTLASLDTVIDLFIRNVDTYFLPDSTSPGGQAAKVGVLRGGWVKGQPWRVILEFQEPYRHTLPPELHAFDFNIDPQQALDHICGDGFYDEAGLANAMFLVVLGNATDAAQDKKQWRDRLLRFGKQHPDALAIVDKWAKVAAQQRRASSPLKGEARG